MTLYGGNSVSKKPIFMLPVFRPLLPSIKELSPILSRIDANRYYTNNGPLVIEFEERLAAAFGVSPDQVITSSNCTMGLVQALRARLSADVASEALCIVPSWTFVATPAAVMLANLQPFFADVSATTWALDPEHVARLVVGLRAAGKTVAAVMSVAPFGAPADVAGWEDFEARTGIPVVIDAAASFDAMTHPGKPSVASVSHIPVVVSLHATKAFGIGEGGVVLSSDTALITRIRKYGNFGFYGSREATVQGWNAKLGEMYAAVGLALFDQWTAVRAEWQSLTDQFCKFSEELAPHARIPAAIMNRGWISTYGLLQLEEVGIGLSNSIEQMARRGIETRQWWGCGCHLQPAYRQCAREELPNTERLASSVLGMPFWRQMDAADMLRSMDVLREVLAQNG